MALKYLFWLIKNLKIEMMHTESEKVQDKPEIIDYKQLF